MGNAAEAEDLASEVFLRAVRAADKFTETGAPMEAWLFRIAANLVTDYHRRRARRPDTAVLEDAASVTDERGNPELPIEQSEDSQMLHQAIQQLSEGQQEVLALRLSSDVMTSSEIAKLIGKSPGAVREIQSAAVKRLRSILEPMNKG